MRFSWISVSPRKMEAIMKNGGGENCSRCHLAAKIVL